MLQLSPDLILTLSFKPGHYDFLHYMCDQLHPRSDLTRNDMSQVWCSETKQTLYFIQIYDDFHSHRKSLSLSLCFRCRWMAFMPEIIDIFVCEFSVRFNFGRSDERKNKHLYEVEFFTFMDVDLWLCVYSPRERQTFTLPALRWRSIFQKCPEVTFIHIFNVNWWVCICCTWKANRWFSFCVCDATLISIFLFQHLEEETWNYWILNYM